MAGRHVCRPCRAFPVPRSRFTFLPVPPRSPVWLALAALATLACGGSSPAANVPAPAPARSAPREPIKPFSAVPFAGQSIAVTPLTLIVALDTLARVPPLADRAASVAWADSIIGTALTSRGPEVKWVLPPELRKIARRAPTIASDPDRMGQSLMREKSLESAPDPLRTQLRTLLALVGGRYAFIPAAVSFIPEPSGLVRAEVSLVLVDTRTARVLWRTLTWGVGATPSQALTAAMDNALPV